MRLSELIKSAPGGTAFVAPQPYVPPPAPAPAPPPPPKEELQPKKEVRPPVERQGMEQEIRGNIEKEFQAKLSKTESDARRFAEQRIKEEEQKFLERENNFMTENQKMLGELDDLRKKNDDLIHGVERLQQEMTRRFEEERKKIEEDLRKEMALTASRLADEAQKKTAEADQLREKEKKLQEEFSRKIDEERSKAQEQARRETARMAEEFQARILQEQKSREVKPPQDLLVPPLQAAPILPPPPPVPSKSPILPLPESQVIFVDAATEEKIRAIYEELVRVGDVVFNEVAEKKSPDMGALSRVLGAMVDLALEKSADMIAIVLEPYREAQYFSAHAANCSILSVILGLDFKLSREDLLDLAHAALLHDAGLVNVRENLDYPKELSSELKEEVKQHPRKGAEIFEGKLNDLALKAILQHHETLNGKGYPDALEAKEIHLFGKIIHCVDSFEAMTHQRPYRKKNLDVNAAIKEIIETGRGVYDRDVLKALMNRVGLYPVMVLVELSNKQIARVVRQNRQFPLSPVVRIEFDEAGNKLKNPPILDLKENQLVHIVGPLSPVVSSYGTKQVEKGKKKPSKYKKLTIIKEIIPFFLIIGLIAAFVYILLKI